MYGVELYAAVRLAVVDEGLSHHEAGRRFGIDRRTVKKMLSYSAPPGYRRTKPVRRPKLDGVTGIVDAILEADTDPEVPRKQGELDLGGNDPQLRHLDHAWASTVHAFQGRTVDNVIAAMEARHPHLTTQKSFYVEISRARDRAELVTDDAGELRAQLQAATGERIAALEGIGEMEREAPEKSVEVGRAAEGQPVHGAGRDTGKERDGPPSSPKDRDLPAPERGRGADRDLGL